MHRPLSKPRLLGETGHHRRDTVVTAALQTIQTDANDRTPFRLSTEGLVFIKGGNRSENFRCSFVMVTIRGTLCMRSHICVHPATTKYLSNAFVFKSKIEKEGLPRGRTPGLGAGGPRFKSGRPDQSFLKLTGISQSPSPQYGKIRGTRGPQPLLHFLHLQCAILLLAVLPLPLCNVLRFSRNASSFRFV